MAREKKRVFRPGLCLLLSLVLLVVGTAGGAYYALYSRTMASDPLPSGDLQIHFLELGNAYTGDCTYIKAGENDILIDAGSRASSVPTIAAYLNEYVSDGVLEYVIVTHAHEDHYAGFATAEDEDSIFDLFVCEVIIDFALTNKSETASMHAKYLRERGDEIAAGATHYTAAECIRQGRRIFDLGNGIELEILDSYYYYHEAETENDYSVCCMINRGDHHYLFTGDLEAKGEEYLVQYNSLPQVDLYKAGHHGSKTSSTALLMQTVQPEIVCVCCCAGSAEYTSTNENQFPTQAFIDRVAPYTDRVYVTTLCLDWEEKAFASMNGNIVLTASGSGLSIACSGSDLLLKDSDWFSRYRETPDQWLD